MTSSLLESRLEDHNYIDPSLLSIPDKLGTNPISFFDSLLGDQSPPLETQSAKNSPANLFRDLPHPPRAVTLPPEDLLFDYPPFNEFIRSTTSSPSRPPRKRSKNLHPLLYPYPRPSKLRNGEQAPTSAPNHNFPDSPKAWVADIPMQSKPGITPCELPLPHEQTILMLALNTYIAEIIRTCEDMQSFLSRASASTPVSPASSYPSSNGGAGDRTPRSELLRIERQRLQAREKNHRAIELHEELGKIVPYPGQDLSGDVVIPGTGLAIRRLNHPHLNALLTAYNIPYSDSMFLSQKKELFLRFMGCGRVLMGRVLD